MQKNDLLRGTVAVFLLPVLACTLARQTPIPAPTLDRLAFEVQTATPTFTPVLLFGDAPTHTPDPNLTPTPLITTTVTATITSTLTVEPVETATPEATAASVATVPPPEPPTPPASPAEPLQGGVWDFEDGFTPWSNPYGEACPGSGLANGWFAFTTQDQFGSACMNETVWKANVYSGVSAQEITFAYVGIEAGIFRSVPTIPGHQYTIEAYMRREFSPAKVEVSMGVDLNGGADWQADTVQWTSWKEDLENEWSRTEMTVTATGENMTLFIKGNHPFPEPGGALRIDSIRITDIGPEA